MLELQKGTMRYYMTNVEIVLKNDEELLRQLVYKPMGYDSVNKKMIPDPLDPSLPDLVDGSEEYWELVNDRIRKGEKRTNIENEVKCYIYLSEGRRRPVFDNHTLSKQEIKVAYYIHESFEDDWRMSSLTDRVRQLLVHSEGIAGIGKAEYVGGDDYDAPKGYRNYTERYVFSTKKKAGG